MTKEEYAPFENHRGQNKKRTPPGKLHGKKRDGVSNQYEGMIYS